MNQEKSDNELMAEFKGCSTAAFNEIVYRYRNTLLKYLVWSYSLRREDCEDVVQDTLVRVWKYKYLYRPRHAFSTWIYTIARRLALNMIRKNKKLLVPEKNIDAILVPQLNDDPSDEIDRKEQVKRMFAKLDPLCRELLVLRYFQDMKFSEIAQLVHRNVNSVKSIVKRNLDNLRNSEKVLGDA